MSIPAESVLILQQDAFLARPTLRSSTIAVDQAVSQLSNAQPVPLLAPMDQNAKHAALSALFAAMTLITARLAVEATFGGTIVV